MKPIGKALNAARTVREPEERRFAKAWLEKEWNILPHIIGTGFRSQVAERDTMVAASVIQWLGSEVGQSFLNELGYIKTLPQRKR